MSAMEPVAKTSWKEFMMTSTFRARAVVEIFMVVILKFKRQWNRTRRVELNPPV
jgi:hypothetical protein